MLVLSASLSDTPLAAEHHPRIASADQFAPGSTGQGWTQQPKKQGPTVIRRLALAAVIGLIVAVILWITRPPDKATWGDLDQTIIAARLVLAGRNPYPLIGPHRLYEFHYPWAYPLPAALLLTPLAGLSFRTANAVFIGVTSALLAYALTSRGWHRLIAFASSSFLWCMLDGQWSCLLLAAFFLPWVGMLSFVKPQVGIPTAVTSWRHWRLVATGSVILIGLSLVLQPRWPIDWFRALQIGTPHYRPALLAPWGIGVVLAAAATRWRRPEARWLLALSLIPQTPGPYTDLLLFAIPSTRLEYIILAGLSYLTLPVYNMFTRPTSSPEAIALYGYVVVPILFLPCLLMVLRRPNIAPELGALHS